MAGMLAHDLLQERERRYLSLPRMGRLQQIQPPEHSWVLPHIWTPADPWSNTLLACVVIARQAKTRAKLSSSGGQRMKSCSLQGHPVFILKVVCRLCIHCHYCAHSHTVYKAQSQGYCKAHSQEYCIGILQIARYNLFYPWEAQIKFKHQLLMYLLIQHCQLLFSNTNWLSPQKTFILSGNQGW